MTVSEIIRRFSHWNDSLSIEIRAWADTGAEPDSMALGRILVNSLDRASLKEPILVGSGCVWEKWMLEDYESIARQRSSPLPNVKQIHAFATAMIEWLASKEKPRSFSMLTVQWKNSTPDDLRFQQYAYLAQEALRKQTLHTAARVIDGGQRLIEPAKQPLVLRTVAALALARRLAATRTEAAASLSQWDAAVDLKRLQRRTLEGDLRESRAALASQQQTLDMARLQMGEEVQQVREAERSLADAAVTARVEAARAVSQVAQHEEDRLFAERAAAVDICDISQRRTQFRQAVLQPLQAELAQGPRMQKDLDALNREYPFI